jgi:Holliday junction resolvasome RuvABC endonuclease subunit
MVESWQPDLIGLEDIQFQKFNNQMVGVTTYKTLAHLQGVLMEVCFENDWNYQICAPATWRAHNKVKGKSRVDKKKSMQKLIKEWFDITVNEDESDAIGIGKYLAETKQGSVIVYNWE